MMRPAAMLICLLVAGCGPRTQLTPDAMAQAVPGMEEAAQDTVRGVRVIAQTMPWPGPSPIQQEITPVRIVIDNGTERPIRLRYGDVRLVGAGGVTLAALPPFEIRGSVDEAVLVETYPRIPPGFAYTGFQVAPYYAPYYPALDPWAGPFAYDPFYWDTHRTVWLEIPLPTPDMLQLALPEGVLRPGGRVDGYLYFQEIPDELDRVTLQLDVVDARSDRRIGRARIPFVVD